MTHDNGRTARFMGNLVYILTCIHIISVDSIHAQFEYKALGNSPILRDYLAALRLLCVCVFSSRSFWTSSSLDVPAGVTQEISSTFLRCVP